ncbi:sensor histidine kinase [Pseudodesulfovibrio sediminis]|uniref:histidine kinase n=1 Tax=Pseudodesulfovibrio sediminis TaxID=2810563 RepID=A0ABM7P8V3_9BACT|nr:HAMP domain-containing sensor histidine kinase [Pseudodesulfovibrio sediminis]BCS89859.1 two-component sensor histidine kinase [Pseudodesulfovibrio sediminis]
MVRPNLRQTIVIGIAIFTFAFGSIALLSLSNINQLQQEVLLVERADDLRNLILEIRREEKNFFLYQDTALFSIGEENLKHAMDILNILSEEVTRPHSKHYGTELTQGIEKYAGLLKQFSSTSSNIRENSPAAHALRETGQSLVEDSRAIAEFERENILLINQELRMTLIISMAVVAVVVLALVFFVSRSILGPLRQVQEATRQIAQGTFIPLEVKNAGDEIQQVFVALNSMVEQLNKRQTQLVQAQKLSSIGTLASGIAHQLNNPLNNISTSAQILSEETAGNSAFADKMMHNIEQETIRARDIVKGLLEFSRHKDFVPQQWNLKTVLDGAIQLVSSQLGPRISVDVQVADEISLFLDRQRFQEALINLMINSIQAIGDNEGRIEIATMQDADHQVITISDTGEGMPPDTLQRIFDPFFSTKDVGQGTGLGLYIVYGIIKEHRGSIRVESVPGQKTTFFIRLPLNQEELA